MSSDQSGHVPNCASFAQSAPPTAPGASEANEPLPWFDPICTAVLVLHDGTVLRGFGVGAVGQATGELCFNTAMTGYQEILTDPSYAGQIITFTFPHIGNVGVNTDDSERVNLPGPAGVRGCVLKAPIERDIESKDSASSLSSAAAPGWTETGTPICP
ncbi:MAG: carbamoyl-phosphate synthase domain-containing protein, partial [Alphaproteobacteria bacterium]